MKNKLISRLTSAGLTTILIGLTAFSIWATLISQQAANRTTVSEYLNDQYQQARFDVGAEESLERKYRLEPGPEPLANHTAAAAALVTALHNIAQRGNAHDRTTVEYILAAHRLYLINTHLMFAAVDKGNTALAIDLDHHLIDPVFTDMQQRVNTEAIRYRAEAVQRLAELAATEQFVFDSTLIVFPIGLILLAGLLFVIRAYQRSEMAHAVAHARIQKQALTDALTGLPNHRAIMDQFNKELDRARRYGRPFSLLFFDADRFKHVNDTYGHAAGDAVLSQIGERASSALRGGDTLGRFGGEEFVILLPEADASEASIVAERIRVDIASGLMATSEVEGGIAMTVSIGLVTYPTDGASEKDLLSQADEAMYVAKRLGRNQVRTAKEAKQVSVDVELMALLQEEGQREAVQRERLTPERLRETSTLRLIYSLLALLERRDQGLSAHAQGVSDLATAIATTMGLEPKQVSKIGMAALLHDIGKVAVPDKILQQTYPLSTHERARLREHAALGAQILEANPFISDLVPGVRHHHEHWNGYGYPDQLAGENIPQAARIIAVAEAYDAMQREYSYQASRSPEKALVELQRCAGTQFDPTVVQALSTLLIEQERQGQSLQIVE
jgi:diguanylate cyclase (GGDEF)-like protein/putative nucleotidyltransferase with HDIG domain